VASLLLVLREVNRVTMWRQVCTRVGDEERGEMMDRDNKMLMIHGIFSPMALS
jgi:hypothetical protein